MQEIFASLEHGAVLLTATRRLTRVFRRDYAAWQRDRGRSLWTTPRILPFDAYVRSLWIDWLSEADEDLILLASEQETHVWAEAIRNSPQSESLLQIDATAQRAMDAWRLLYAYRLPVDDRFQVTEDCAAFRGWAREFERRCTRKQWIDNARLPDFILEKLRSGAIDRPASAWHAGFDELTPQHREFLDEIAAKPYHPPYLTSSIRTKVCSTSDDEIRCSAEWSRRILETIPAARIGIVVLNLSQIRSKVESIFRDVLQPGAIPAAESAFHISLGRPLDRYPIIYAALLILDFATGPQPLPKAGMLLRSPWIGGWAGEKLARASIDARLRRYGSWQTPIAELKKLSHLECPVLNRALTNFQNLTSRRQDVFSLTEWSRTFSELLGAMGWPGDRTLDTHDHQLLHRWTELLSQFAALDTVSAPVPVGEAGARLRALAAASIFQFEDTGAPVQISDHSEIAGVRFDHLWVLGLHDESLPAPPNPNPFIPVAIQWEHHLPNSSAEFQQGAATRLFDRLTSSAPGVSLSYPESEADRKLSPSPLLTGVPQRTTADPSPWIASIRASAKLETFIDETGPPVTAEGVHRGGARLLADVAACPFRAFANHRLQTRELEEIEPGLSRRDKGTAAHETLRSIWSELRSNAALKVLSAQDLEELVRRNIASVLDRFEESTSIAVERIRLQKVLTEWLVQDRTRPPFAVVNLEENKTIEIGGLRLEVRADRVDQLEDGTQAIIDYKTGVVKAQGWTGPRIEQPQVPLYCISSEAPVAAAAFARLKVDAMDLTGISDTPLLTVKPYGKNEPPLAMLIPEWRQGLTSLAEQFRSGDARVDPKNGDKTCEYCKVISLCRIREINNG